MLPLAREILRGGGEVVLAANSLPAINDITFAELEQVVDHASNICPIIKAARTSAQVTQEKNGGRVPPPPGMMQRPSSMNNLSALIQNDSPPSSLHASQDLCHVSSGGTSEMESPASACDIQCPGTGSRQPRLYIVANGQGSPCLDLQRVSKDVADATVGTDLVIIEGMGRAIHTNFGARLKCDSLKLAMIKNKHLAARLFNGNVYDCICRFDEGLP